MSLYKKLQDDLKVDFHSKILVYDPDRNYVEVTGYAVQPDGGIVLQTPD